MIRVGTFNLINAFKIHTGQTTVDIGHMCHYTTSLTEAQTPEGQEADIAKQQNTFMTLKLCFNS